MSAATLPTSTVEIPSTRPGSVWRNSLWKDWRQVWQLVVGIAAIQVALQLWLGAMEAVLPDSMRNLANATINVALAAPTLMAIACSGVLIGQERQTGSWAWSSSLPVTWQHSLLSKTLIWLVSSVVLVGLLMGVAAIALGMNERTLGAELLRANSPSDLMVWTYWMTVIISAQVFIYFSLAALLIKDTLLAFVVAGIGMFVFHILALTVNFEGIVYRAAYGESIARLLVAYSISFIVGCLFLALTYRWRWGVGQYAPLPFFGRTSSVAFARPQRAAWQSYAVSEAQPSEFRMLLEHGVLCALGLRIAVVCGALLIIALVAGDLDLHSCVAVVCIASCLLGVTVFSGDQPANRFRFLADRGVNWRKMLVGHALPPALLATVLFAIVSFIIVNFQRNGSNFLAPLLLCVPFFIVGAFSSLVFASPIISLTVTLVVLFSAFALNAASIAVWSSVVSGDHWETIALWLPVSTLILLLVAIRLVPRWLRDERFNAMGIYFGTVFIAALLPGLLTLSFGFLTIPNVAWQGTPLEQIKPVDWTGGPDLDNAGSALNYVGLHVADRTLNRQIGLADSRLSTSLKEQTLALVEVSDAWFDEQEQQLDVFERVGPPPAKIGFDELRKLNLMVENSAVLALMATDQRKEELAVRAWKANRKLIAFCQQPALLAATMYSAAFVWEIWNTMSDNDLRFLAKQHDLNELTPPPLVSIEEFREVLKARATLRQFMSNSFDSALLTRFGSYGSSFRGVTPLVVYPPIRWAIERRQAIALMVDLGETKGEYGDRRLWDFANEFRDRLYTNYLDLRFLSDSFPGRLMQLK